MLFAYPTGVQGNVVSPGSTSSSSRTTSRPGANIRKLADAPEAVTDSLVQGKGVHAACLRRPPDPSPERRPGYSIFQERAP